MEEEIICKNCGWTGDATMLICTDVPNDESFIHCPECGSNDIEDIE